MAAGRSLISIKAVSLETMGNGTVSESNSALIRLPSQSEVTDLNLSCSWARFAFVSLRPVVLDLGV